MAIKPQVGYTPVTDPLNCEVCGKSIPLSQAVSIIPVVALAGLDTSVAPLIRQLAPYQCKNEQHYACSYKHAIIAMVACLVSHMDDNRHNSTVNGDNDDKVHDAIKQGVQKYTS